MTHRRTSQRPCKLIVALTAALILSPFTSLQGDDRGLFQSVNASPYVFMIFDISGSMTWRTDNGGRTVHGMDDPDSRIYQAKRALFQVLEDPSIGDSLRYGWATFERGSRTKLVRKHWIYTPTENPPWYSSIPLFGAGAPIIFGDPLNATDNYVSTFQNYFATGAGTWTYRTCGGETTNWRAIHDFPKADSQGVPFTRLYYRQDGTNYRITFHPLAAPAKLGEPEINVRIRIDRRNGSCRSENSGAFNGQYQMLYNEVIRMVPIVTGDGLDPEIPLQPFPDVFGNSYSLAHQVFTYRDYDDNRSPAPAPSCSGDGWESNFDNDASTNNPLSYDRQNDPLFRGSALGRGDIVPWDWEDGIWPTNARKEILYRLAPNLSIGEPTPDFRSARYWHHERNGDGVLPLRPEFTGRPPIMPAGLTPIGQSLNAFGDWYETWEPAARDDDTGDERLDCRQRYVILITDGEDTCDTQSYVCAAATRLRQQGNRVYVVGFAFSGDRLTLDCIADNGGTGSTDHNGDGLADGPGPIFVESPDELVERLREVFVEIQSEATTVSAAAVPSVQVDVSDRLFLTEFLPLENEAVWPARIKAHVAPLVLNEEGLPVERPCVDKFDSSCLAWEAQTVLVNEQYDDTIPVGNNKDQRRIYYSEFREATENAGVPVGPGGAMPAQRQFWQPLPPAAAVPPAVISDLALGFGINPSDADARDQINEVIGTHLTLRTKLLPNGATARYLMGDIFHSDPLLLQAPSNPTYMALDLMGDLEVNCEEGDPNSYRCFALLHEHRRKAIVVGSNGGMLHAFDAGNFQLDEGHNPAFTGRFDNGTGRELFAYVPRVVMPTIKDLAVDQPYDHKYTVDGSPVAADVFIDPVHGGVASGDPPSAAQREWRTVVMGGMRRGGSVSAELVDPAGADPLATAQVASGYYLLDMTQPDLIDAFDSYGAEEPDPDLLPDVWIPNVADPTEPPACLGDGDGSGVPLGCGPVAYGTPLWEFNDTLSGVSSDGEYVEGLRLDEDDNGWVDLAPTWSTPVIGRIQVCVGSDCDPADPDADDDLRDRYVAIFGGGHDPESANARGNFVYMVDVETGTTLYKREVYGSVPARPVAQLSVDGYIERLYIATTLGFLYRIDLRPELGASFDIPRVTAAAVSEDSSLHTGTVSASVERIWGADFEPKLLFNANDASVADVINGVATEIQPIFIEPTLIFVLQRNANALLFGTGNRENIFLKEQPAGRFFALVDDISESDLRAGSFSTLDATDLVNTTGETDNPDVLLDSTQQGWWLEFDDDERLVGRPFAVSGVLFFSTYIPTETLPTAGNVCEEKGFSRVYGVFAASSNPLLIEDDIFVRSEVVPGLVTKPFAVPYQTQNTPQPGAGDPLDESQLKVFKELMRLFPSQCHFPPGMRIDINVRSQNTGLERIAALPICVIESAFREKG